MNDSPTLTTLIADDERHVRLLMRGLLEDMGCQVVAEAADVAEALAQFRRHRPKLTMLDVTMPRVDGIEALKAIRDESPDAFIIMLTGQASMTLVEQCLDLGAANYLRKDTPLARMKQEIRESWLDRLAEAPRQAPEGDVGSNSEDDSLTVKQQPSSSGVAGTMGVRDDSLAVSQQPSASGVAADREPYRDKAASSSAVAGAMRVESGSLRHDPT